MRAASIDENRDRLFDDEVDCVVGVSVLGAAHVVCSSSCAVDASADLDRVGLGTKGNDLAGTVEQTDDHTGSGCIGAGGNLAVDYTAGAGVVVHIADVGDKSADTAGGGNLADDLAACSAAGEGVTL